MIAARAQQLREAIRHHEHLYYVLSRPEISDHDFDALERELQDIEDAHPDLITHDSPTQRVGGAPISGFAPVAHSEPMLSLEKGYSEADVRAWLDRVWRYLNVHP